MNPLDISIANIWRSWFDFVKGKRKTLELELYRYHLEANLTKLREEIISSNYRHGEYRQFVVCDNKRRQIKVASVKDRVVHRVVYNYLVGVYDKSFIFDAWSCRKNKGLLGAIIRAQKFMRSNPGSFVWRADIKKFFDNVDRQILWDVLRRKVRDNTALFLLAEVMGLPRRKNSLIFPPEKGIPIGNLTSQVLANIYLNEFDRFIKHRQNVKYYLRYGDDFIIFANSLDALQLARSEAIEYLETKLNLSVNRNNDIILKTKQGIRYLGVQIFPGGRKLTQRSWYRAISNLSSQNYSSYWGLVNKYCNRKKKLLFDWNMLDYR